MTLRRRTVKGGRYPVGMAASVDFTIAFKEPDEEGWIVARGWRCPAPSARAAREEARENICLDALRTVLTPDEELAGQKPAAARAPALRRRVKRRDLERHLARTAAARSAERSTQSGVGRRSRCPRCRVTRRSVRASCGTSASSLGLRRRRAASRPTRTRGRQPAPAVVRSVIWPPPAVVGTSLTVRCLSLWSFFLLVCFLTHLPCFLTKPFLHPAFPFLRRWGGRGSRGWRRRLRWGRGSGCPGRRRLCRSPLRWGREAADCASVIDPLLGVGVGGDELIGGEEVDVGAVGADAGQVRAGVLPTTLVSRPSEIR